VDGVISRANLIEPYDFPVARSPMVLQRDLFFATRHLVPRNSLLLFVFPFSFDVWFFCLLTFAAGILAALMLAYYHGDDWSVEVLFMTATWTGETYLEKSIHLSHSLSRDVFIVFWVPSLAFLTMFYTSNLRASLFKPIREKPVDTVQDILDNNMAVALMEHTHIYNYMKTDAKPLIQKLFQKVNLIVACFFCILAK